MMDGQLLGLLVLLAATISSNCTEHLKKSKETLKGDDVEQALLQKSAVLTQHQLIKNAESTFVPDHGTFQTEHRSEHQIFKRASKCPPGYSPRGLFRRCEPVCGRKCSNGKCVAPDTCKCDTGFELDRMNIFSCIPSCSPQCRNATCVKTNKCGCFPGYEPHPMLPSTCVPICKPSCVGGTCVAPSRCQCLPGFIPTGHNLCAHAPLPSGHALVHPQVPVQPPHVPINPPSFPVNPRNIPPLCSQPCIGSHCIGPDTCQCKHGFVQRHRFECGPPHCSRPCINGTCTMDNFCTCLDGYKKSPSDSFACLPNCSHSCIGGTCIAPEHCACFKGYAKLNSFECELIHCDRPCDNGTCVGKNKCACNSGYMKSLSDLFSCKPFCSQPCKGGFCSAPETCKCTGNFVKKSKYECVLIHCDQPCGNGTCVGSNECTCNPGYMKSQSDPFKCVPYCSQICEGGFCAAPETCKCMGNFVKKSKYECGSPHCRRPCINATCTDNDFCTCLPNYKKAVGDSFRCEPVCSPACGANATCHSPNHCECLGGFVRSPSGRCERPSPAGGCSSGFARVGGKCVPVCTGGCVNGVCTAPNRCLCNAGFIKDKISSNVCVRNAG